MTYIGSHRKFSLVQNLVLLIVRVVAVVGLGTHGYAKILTLMSTDPVRFVDFLGLGPKISISLAIFGELVAPAFVLLGIFTRFFSMFPVFTMFYALFFVHILGGDPFNVAEPSMLYLLLFLMICTFGAGDLSLDAVFFSKKRGDYRD
ncbi:MAG: DoxX family protein [Bergeyella sp.]|nr:DoxX family protein [Bergeyella sp.]